jgi:poly-beta-1,6-N-acetyl-D-glucosamine synthase
MKTSYKYLLITPARNEETYIERTIKSVISQSVLPEKWAIVSDGSTDRTEEIVSSYAEQYDFIQLLCVEGDRNRNFGSKVKAFNAGYESIKKIEHDYLGNLDADISFQSDYFERLLLYFSRDAKLGIIGGFVYDYQSGTFQTDRKNLNSVPGAVQFFRRECYEEIGGLKPISLGCEDGVVEVEARMHGWKTHCLPELKVYHYRPTGNGEGSNLLRIHIKSGKIEYMIGYHPLFHLARICQGITKKPFLLGGIVKTVSFWWYYIQRKKRPVSNDFINFLRREELEKLKALFLKAFKKSFS